MKVANIANLLSKLPKRRLHSVWSLGATSVVCWKWQWLKTGPSSGLSQPLHSVNKQTFASASALCQQTHMHTHSWAACDFTTFLQQLMLFGKMTNEQMLFLAKGEMSKCYFWQKKKWANISKLLIMLPNVDSHVKKMFQIATLNFMMLPTVQVYS